MKIPEIARHLRNARKMFEPALGPTAEPLDLRVAVVDDIERHVTVVGIDHREFAYDLVVVRLLENKRTKRPLERAFAGLDERVRERLREIRCAVPRAMSVRVTFIKNAPRSWAPEQLFSIDYGVRRTDGVEHPAAEQRPQLKLTVTRGKAAKKVYVFPVGTIVHVGRLTEIRDSKGGVRINQVAFDDANTTVSRKHVTLRFDTTRRAYFVVDEQSAHGTRLVRGDSSKPVRPDSRGVRIEPGDHIELGDACLLFKIE